MRVPTDRWLRRATCCFVLLFLASFAHSLTGRSLTAAAELQYPLSVAANDSGAIFLADRNLPGVWKLDGKQLTVLFQGEKKFRTSLNAVRCVALDGDGKLLAGDSSTRDVFRFDASGKPQPLTAQDNSMGQVGIPMDIVTDADGNLVVSDLELHRIVKIPKNGGNAEEFAKVTAPKGLCFDSKNRLWVIANRQLVRLSPDGKQETVVQDGVFQFPHTVVVTDDDTAFVCDGYAKAVWKIPPGGKPTKLVSGEPLVNPVGMERIGDKLLIVDPRAKALFELDMDGKLTQREMQISQ